MSTPFTSRDILRERLPDLLVGPNHTTNSAIHDTYFDGPLRQWENFEEDCIRTDNSQTWDQTPVMFTVASPGHDLFQVEQVHVGDEHGVQGRLQQRVGQALSVIAAQREVDFAFGDFKCVVSPYTKVPDCMMMSQFGAAKVVGEVKTPWVQVHNLTRKVTSADYGQEGPFRQYLGQIAKYMNDLGLKYGFLTTYEDTVFLRQVIHNRLGVLEYSPVIHHSNTFSEVDGTVTLRQCFFHVALLALEDAAFQDMNQRSQKWTR